jgi:hypothetical protein
MYCNYCVKVIEDNSNFCSFCGGIVTSKDNLAFAGKEKIENPFHKEEPELVKKTLKKVLNRDQGFLFSFVIMVGLRFFWIAMGKMNIGKNVVELDYTIKYLMKPSYVIFWCIPLLMAFYVKRMDQKLLMILFGIIVIALSVFENYLQ